MKKSLLIAALALASAAPAFALGDGFEYETINGITCANRWIADRNSTIGEWNKLPFAEMPAKARTACLGVYNGVDAVIVGFSKTMTVDDKSDDYAHLVILDFATGKVLKTVQMTCNGEPVKGLLCANQVGCDQFGHVWFAGYVASTYNAETAKFTPYVIYNVTDLENGICEKAAELVLPEDETNAIGRIDYSSLVGDITLQQGPCAVMTPLASAAEPFVVAWVAEQGATEWTGGMDGYFSSGLTETYPEGQTSWGTAPMCRIVLNEDYTNDLFYVDGFTTTPSLYNNTGTMLESFAKAVDLAPKPGTNGVGEFNLGGRDFIAYSMAQYDVTPGCQVRVAELGEGQSFDGMTSYWVVPENGLGEVSDTGTRIHSVETKKYTDANGKEYTYLLTYKCNNGIGVYVIGEEGFEDANGGVNDIVADDANVNAPVEYFNLNGVAVDGNNLVPGLYITRQGNNVNKVVVK